MNHLSIHSNRPNVRVSRRTLALAAACLLMFAGGKAAWAIDVEEVRWGFDGRVMHHQFNLLSVLVSNHSDRPFEGRLQLRKHYGSTPVGAPLAEPVFISPYSTRWVQFYPYVMSQGEEWTLSWGRSSRERYDLGSPSPGGPAHVLLEEPGGLLQGGRGLKGFPDNLFPPHVTATDGLASVVLDHVPRWEEVRRQAFLEWLHGGGTVHLLRGVDGRHPQFPASLAELNAPLEVQRVGAGFVYRHAADRHSVDGNFIRSTVLRQTTRETSDDELGEVEGQRTGRGNPLDPDDYNYGYWDGDLSLFTKLKNLTRADHNWAIIYLLSFVYILVIFPGCYLLGLKRVDYRWTFGALLAAVAVFSLAFGHVGRRGYGEATAVHSLAIARALPEGHFNVMQWTNVFVTAGDYYPLEHGGTGRLYSTCQQAEAVNGVIENGTQGAFLADIPPFSARTFGHKTRLHAGDFGLKVLSWDMAGDRLGTLEVSVGEDFPPGATQIYALHRDRIYSLGRTGGPNAERLRLTANLGTVAGFLDFEERGYRYNPWRRQEVPAAQMFHESSRYLMARSLSLYTARQAARFRLPDDDVRLFVYAPMPESFHLQDPRLKQQAGYVLYSLNLNLAQTRGGM